MYVFIHIYILLSVYISRNIYKAIHHMYQEYMGALGKLPGDREGGISAVK